MGKQGEWGGQACFTGEMCFLFHLSSLFATRLTCPLSLLCSALFCFLLCWQPGDREHAVAWFGEQTDKDLEKIALTNKKASGNFLNGMLNNYVENAF